MTLQNFLLIFVNLPVIFIAIIRFIGIISLSGKTEIEKAGMFHKFPFS